MTSSDKRREWHERNRMFDLMSEYLTNIRPGAVFDPAKNFIAGYEAAMKVAGTNPEPKRTPRFDVAAFDPAHDADA